MSMSRETEVALRQEHSVNAAIKAMVMIAKGDIAGAVDMVSEAQVTCTQLVTDYVRLRRDEAVFGKVGGNVDPQTGSAALTIAKAAILVAAGNPEEAIKLIKEVGGFLGVKPLAEAPAPVVVEPVVKPEAFVTGVLVTEVEPEVVPRVSPHPEPVPPVLGCSMLQSRNDPLLFVARAAILEQALVNHRWVIQRFGGNSPSWWSIDVHEGWVDDESSRTLFTTEERFELKLPDVSDDCGFRIEWVLLTPEDVLAHQMTTADDDKLKMVIPPIYQRYDMANQLSS